MADWYVSSVNYNALPTFAVSHAYNVGDIIRPTSPPNAYTYLPQRCTTAGTSGTTEPGWAAGSGSTTTTGGATFTNVGGTSTYNWAAPVGTLASLSFSATNNPVPGDRIFVSSDHNETVLNTYQMGTTASPGVLKILSVNKAGSVPPVEADLTSGASITGLGGGSNMVLDALCNIFWQGFTFTSGSGVGFTFNSTGVRQNYHLNCRFVFTGTGSAVMNTNNPASTVFDNTTVTFSTTTQGIASASSYALNLIWLNTPAALAGSTFPAALFKAGINTITCRGVDLSALTGTLVSPSPGAGPQKILFDSCKIAPGVTRYGAPTNTTESADEVELVNCYDGTHFLSERYTPAGAVTTEFSTTFSGGASDDVGAYSHKLLSNTQPDISAMPLESFWMDVENTLTGAAHTATVEIISSATLNNTDISLLLEYQGTAGSSVASFASTLSSTLAVASALPSSSGTWNNPPATPQKQHLAVTFTPQVAGRVRGRVRLGKPSTTVWVNPQIAIT